MPEPARERGVQNPLKFLGGELLAHEPDLLVKDLSGVRLEMLLR
jgi:hypothetical protein